MSNYERLRLVGGLVICKMDVVRYICTVGVSLVVGIELIFGGGGGSVCAGGIGCGLCCVVLCCVVLCVSFVFGFC